jgi:hypothetical protein
MKVFLTFFLFVPSLVGAFANDTELHVTVTVLSDPDIQLAVKSYFTRELRKIPDIVVQDEEQSAVELRTRCGVVKLSVSQSSWTFYFCTQDLKDLNGIRDRFSGNPTALCPDACSPSATIISS